MSEVKIRLPDVTLRTVTKIAEEEDITLGQVIRDALRREFARRDKAKKAVRPDERYLAPLRDHLGEDFAHAISWQDLLNRLRGKGYNLSETGGGLIVTNEHGQRVCRTSDLNFSGAKLLRRFGKPFPRASEYGQFASTRACA